MRFFSLVLLFFLGYIGNSIHLCGAEDTFLYIIRDETENGRYNVFQDITKDAFDYLHSRNDIRNIYFKYSDFPVPLKIGEEGYLYLAQLSQLEKLVLGMCQKSSDLNDKNLLHLQTLKNLRYFHICANTISDEGFKMFGMFPHLEWLGIPNAAISDLGLKNLTDLKNLQENLYSLQISDCTNITEEGVKSVIALKRLNNLYIQGCGFSGVGLKGLNLKVLMADRSAINDEGLRCIAEMNNLRSLGLSFCENITDTGLGELGALLQLEELYLNGCKQINDWGLRSLATLKKLRKLDLRGCEKITDQGLQYLASLVNLQELNLEDCSQITGSGFSNLRALSRVKIVHLCNCPQLNDSGLRGLVVLKELRELHLACCEGITDSGLLELTPLTKLEWLNLNGCSQITDAGLKNIAALKKLRYLELDECKEITDAGLNHLIELKQLEHLSVLGCSKITKKGLKKFHKQHPECAIMGGYMWP